METIEREDEINDRPAVEEARGLSLLREAEERRAALSEDLYMGVPSWGGDLIARYRVIDRTRLDGLTRKIQQLGRSGNTANARTAADIDLILEANVGIYAYDPELNPDLDDAVEVAGLGRRGVQPIEDEFGVVTWDRFGDTLKRIRPDITASLRTSREVVLHATRSNSVAITTHALALARWMRDPSQDPMEGLD